MKTLTSDLSGIVKCPTGIRGLDDITDGGLPRGRTTLVCGAAGSGKTLLAMEFLVHGAREFSEPGVFLSFEEPEEELAANVASFGFDVPALVHDQKLFLDHVHIERGEIEQTGVYDLEGLFVRLGSAIDTVGAKRVVIDSIESLFAGLPDEAILRSELRRLFRWLKERSVTVILTGEQGDRSLTRHGLEEYVSDCVIFLDHRVANQVATRRLRIVKYRGSPHGTNEYPTMIDEDGLSVFPISSLGLSHHASTARISTGIPRLDMMLEGKGYYQGSSILVSGTAGTGKSSIAAAFADQLCREGGRCLYWSSEESPDQILRNMASIGLDLGRHVRAGLLQFHSVRPTVHGLESHLVSIHKQVTTFKPQAVIMDPITNLSTVGNDGEVKAMLTRVIDYFKSDGITGVFTSLTTNGDQVEISTVGISSLMDTWLLLRMVESANERNRLLYVLKSRGMAHSNQMREFVLTGTGIDLRDVYIGPGAVYTGSARLNQEARDHAEALAQQEESERRRRNADSERHALAAQIAALQARIANLDTDGQIERSAEQARLAANRLNQDALARARQAD